MSFPSTGLLERLKAYCFPAGENAVRGVLGIKTTQSARFTRNSFRFKNGVLSLSKIGGVGP